MRRINAAHKLHINLQTRHCKLSAGEVAAVEECLEALVPAIDNFPVVDVKIAITYFSSSEEYHVRLTVVLPSRTLFTGEHDAVPLPAYERCVRKMAHLVREYGSDDRGSASTGAASPSEIPTDPVSRADAALRIDAAALSAAASQGDFHAFRTGLLNYAPAIERYVRHYLKHYPGVIELNLPIEAIVDEVILTAFDRFRKRPAAMRVADWIDGLIAPTVRSFLRHPEEELEGQGFARTVREQQSPSPSAVPSGTNANGNSENGSNVQSGNGNPLRRPAYLLKPR